MNVNIINAIHHVPPSHTAPEGQRAVVPAAQGQGPPPLRTAQVSSGPVLPKVPLKVLHLSQVTGPRLIEVSPCQAKCGCTENVAKVAWCTGGVKLHGDAPVGNKEQLYGEGWFGGGKSFL